MPLANIGQLVPIATIKAVAQSRGIQIHSQLDLQVPFTRAKNKPGSPKEPTKVVAIGISTGGPQSARPKQPTKAEVLGGVDAWRQYPAFVQSPDGRLSGFGAIGSDGTC